MLSVQSSGIRHIRIAVQLVHHPLRNLPSSQTETVPLNTASTPRSPRPCRHCHGAWWRRCLGGSDSLGTRISGTQRLPGWLADLAHRTALKAAQAAGVRSPSALRLRNSPCAADHILPSVTCGGHLCAPWLRWTMLCEPGGHRLSPPGGVCVSAVNGTLVGIEFLRLDQRLVVGHHPHRRDWNSSDPGVPVRPCPRPRSWPLRVCVLSSQHVLCVESTAEPLGLASWLSLRCGEHRVQGLRVGAGGQRDAARRARPHPRERAGCWQLGALGAKPLWTRFPFSRLIPGSRVLGHAPAHQPWRRRSVVLVLAFGRWTAVQLASPCTCP